MQERTHNIHRRVAQIVVWMALSVLLLWYLGWGSERVRMTSFYQARYSVRMIWDSFRQGLPGGDRGIWIDLVFWVAIATMIVGVLALLWLALVPGARELDETGAEQSRESRA